VKIAVIGGGPGGLFFAVLMKRADASHQITVFERNAPDATFGFGVVFPERSLRYLRDADEATHDAFSQAAVSWDAIEFRHAGRVLRCGGHAFLGIARVDLLALLQRQARVLGVDLRFQQAIDDLAVVAGYDLVVAADGVNSLARRTLADQLRPAVHTGRSRYIWLGTTQAFDALTFIFEQNAHGWFAGHIYPYGPSASTFIVETDEASWRRAGLDRSAETEGAAAEDDSETLAYCERLFARHLNGHPLLANNSRWLNFRTVRNRAWRAGRVVLIGDAAHTAHYSVGSGTRMALEDAIALARALRDDADLSTAVAAYERDRRPAVGRIQQAAEPSRRWWERFRLWIHFAPEQFAFHHLARTRVLTYGTLVVRDADFVRSAESWFAQSAGAGAPVEDGPLPPAAAPLRLRDVVLPNRTVATVAAADERPGRRGHASPTDPMQHAGLIMVDTAAPLGIPEVSRAGGRASEPVAARFGLDLTSATPTGADLINDCVKIAHRAAASGFDLLMLDCTGVTVDGTDALSLVEALRAAWPAGRPLGARLTAWIDPEDDQSVEAGLRIAAALKDRGCDVIAVSPPGSPAGRDPERTRVAHTFTSDLVRNVVGLPTMLVGGAYSVGDVNALILSGQADLCEWPRLAWPGWRPLTGIGRVAPRPGARSRSAHTSPGRSAGSGG